VLPYSEENWGLKLLEKEFSGENSGLMIVQEINWQAASLITICTNQDLGSSLIY
jgi:hypothetical protein